MNCKHIRTNTMATFAVRSRDYGAILGYNRMRHCKVCGKTVCEIYKVLNGRQIARFEDLGGDGRRNEARAREVVAQ